MSLLARRIAWIGGGVVAALFLLLVGILAAVDHGAATGLLRAGLEGKLHRSVRFRRYHARLLSGDPSVTLEDVAISSPPEITREDLLHARRVVLRLRPGTLWAGRVDIQSIAVDGAELRLVRLGHARNNYTFGKGGSNGLLARLESLSLTGVWRMDDPDRHIVLSGAINHDGRPGVARPLTMTGKGAISEQPVDVVMHGAALNGRKPSAPWALDATVVDGAATMAVDGTAQQPFDFRGFDLLVKGRGPNLAVLGWLLRTETPNSPPFTLAIHATHRDHVTRLADIHARLGASDVTGWVVSDHSKPHRLIRADLAFGELRAADLRALLAHRAPHALARAAPGGADQPSGPGGLDKPFPFAGLKTQDAAVSLTAKRLSGAALALHDLSLKAILADGRLEVSPLAVGLPSGQVDGDLSLDAAGSKATVRARLTGARLARLRPGLKTLADGDLSASIVLAGAGTTPRAALRSAHGRGDFSIRRGVLQRAPAVLMGGDALQVGLLAFGDRKALTPLSCAGGAFAIDRGVARVESLVIATPGGAAHGAGSIDLASGEVRLRLQGHPTGRFSVAAPPVTLSGPIAHPKVGVDKVGLVARGAGGAALAIVTAPIAALAGGQGGAPPQAACPG